MSGQDSARQHKARNMQSYQFSETRLGAAGQGPALRGVASQDATRQGKEYAIVQFSRARPDAARRGAAGLGKTAQGKGNLKENLNVKKWR